MWPATLAPFRSPGPGEPCGRGLQWAPRAPWEAMTTSPVFSPRPGGLGRHSGRPGAVQEGGVIREGAYIAVAFVGEASGYVLGAILGWLIFSALMR